MCVAKRDCYNARPGPNLVTFSLNPFGLSIWAKKVQAKSRGA